MLHGRLDDLVEKRSAVVVPLPKSLFVRLPAAVSFSTRDREMIIHEITMMNP